MISVLAHSPDRRASAAAATGSTVRVANSGGRAELPVGVALGAQRLRLSHGPLQHHALGVSVGNGVGLPVPEHRHLVEDLPLRVREAPALHPPVVGGQVAGRDRQSLSRHDEDQQAALGQVARRLRQEGVLRPFVFRVVVVGRIQEEQAEGPVRYRRGEQVRGQGAVEPLLGLLSPVPVQLDAVGLDGQGVGPVEALGQPFQRVPGPAAGVEDAERLPVAPIVTGRGVNQLRDQVNDPIGEWGSSPLWPGQLVSCRVSFPAAFRRRLRCLWGRCRVRPPRRLPGSSGSRAPAPSPCSRRRRYAEGGYQFGAVGDGHAPHQRRAALRQSLPRTRYGIVPVEHDRGVALAPLPWPGR